MSLCFHDAHAAEKSDGWYNEQRLLYFGIPVQLRFRGGDPALAEKVWAYLESIDTHFNDYQAESEISRINTKSQVQAAQHIVSPEMSQAILKAQQVHILSGGAFDVTLGPLRRLWKQAAKDNSFPSTESVVQARSQTGMQYIYLDGNELHILKQGLSLDLGGIIKGIAVDNAIALLKKAGIKDAMVQVGGETACMGISQRAKPHVFAIPDPREPSKAIQIIQDPGTGYSGCTSGNYRQPIIIEGTPYYHIFDPRSGMPTARRVLSVSVVFPETGRNGLADALSTAGVVLGPEEILPIVHGLGGACLVYVMTENDTVKSYASERWGDYVYTE